MRHYETMVIITDQLDEEAAQEVVDRITTVVGEQAGKVLETAWWGKRPFAYEINHRNFGYYVVFDLEITDEGLREVERQMRLSDNVVRFKSVRPEIRVHANA